MPLPKPEPLCRYRYDPLDRLAGCLPLGQADTRCFYRLNRLTTKSQGPVGTSWLQTEDLLLAQWRHEAKRSESLLVATDRQGSVIHAIETDRQPSFVYTPYGVRQPAQAPLHLPGFNGERPDPVTGHYLLGNGYRAFNPVLMRFNSPDSLSPFGEGGLNAYAYCVGDPVNQTDASGHIGVRLAVRLYKRPKQLQAAFKMASKAKHATNPVNDKPFIQAVKYVLGARIAKVAEALPPSSLPTNASINASLQPPPLPPRISTPEIPSTPASKEAYDYVNEAPRPWFFREPRQPRGISNLEKDQKALIAAIARTRSPLN